MPLSFSSQNQKFHELANSLALFKVTSEHIPSQQSIESDVVNYLFIKDNYKETAQSISDITDFLLLSITNYANGLRVRSLLAW